MNTNDMFDYFLNINNEECIHPTDAHYVAFFRDYMNDRYYIYCAYTKPDFSDWSINEISESTFDFLYHSAEACLDPSKPILIDVESEEQLVLLIQVVNTKIKGDLKTIGEMLNLN